jgi:valyl-tRNA synthetase
MDELSQSAIDAVEGGHVRILPSRYSKGYLDWLGEKRDWPVSRQLWWGHQIPIWSLRCSDEDSQQKMTAVISQDPAVLAGTACYRLETDPTENGAATIHVCIAEENNSAELRMEQLGFQREEDVLDTWFSSALWPHSTLGWPEKTPDLDYYYPTNVLITSRDIITLWVARMVLTGLNNMGEVPFHDVFIHPKILDGYGETMSKSKGNGVDPLDVLEKFGPDALRFALTYLTTELQDVRMPVQFECPHCLVLIDQTKENRDLPRVTCKKCGKDFSTQWARTEEDRALPRGAAVSERFDLARKFCNKLWNASRFSLMNLAGYTDGPIDHDQLTIEDRWILSRLSTVTQQVTEALEGYHYSEAARMLYGFAWDDFCDYYIEMAKVRLSGNDGQTTAQRVLAHSLDTLLRLLHPVIPFVTEEIWQLLGQAAPRRGLDTTDKPSTCLMAASWPSVLPQWQDEQTEQRFERFKDVLRALRRIRSDQNISKRKPIKFSVRCNAETVELLQPLAAYFESLEFATGTAWGGQVEPSPSCAQVKLADMEIFVDLAGLIDVEAEMARLKKELERVHKQVSGKEQKLSNANFVDRAPAEIVDRERSSLLQLQQQAMSLKAALAALEKNRSDGD